MMYHAFCFRIWYLVFALHDVGRKRLRKQPDSCGTGTGVEVLLPVPKHPSEGSKHRQECRCHTNEALIDSRVDELQRSQC